jgi:hypothetical protein
VDPDRNYAGLRDVLNDLPDDGMLEIFLAHGMRVDAPPDYAAEIAGVAKRLALVSLEDPNNPPSPQPLVLTTPDLVMDGVHIFGEGSTDGRDCKTFQPRVTVERWKARSGNKHVTFYRFEYWQALAFIECRYIIVPDTRVIAGKTKFGKNTREAYCAGPPWNSPGYSQLSELPEWGNQMIKSEIMEWGLSDAMIATSKYRAVLRQAVREALEKTTAGAVAEARRSSMSLDAVSSGVGGSAQIPDNYPYRFVFITESLGSYVISDALDALTTPNPTPAFASGAELDGARVASQLQSARFAICGTTQVHMFANQLALLRLSELTLEPTRLTDNNAPTSSARDENTQQTPFGHPRAHFFRGCDDSNSTQSHSRNGVSFGARQVVAYHEPNDLLSYYTSDRPGLVSTQNSDTTNVVIPYMTVWIPLLAADPVTAHTGQPNVAAIMDLVACGRIIGQKPNCTVGGPVGND